MRLLLRMVLEMMYLLYCQADYIFINYHQVIELQVSTCIEYKTKIL